MTKLRSLISILKNLSRTQITNMEDNPFWGEPTPTDVWDDMQKLDHLYEELLWDHRDRLEFAIEGNHITIRNRSREGR